MKTIPLTQGYVALVDDSDYDAVSQYRWQAQIQKSRSPSGLKRVYATREYVSSDGKRCTQRMHRLILGLTDPKIDVDHRDGDGLNNRRSNLRIATRRQNGSNQRKRPNKNKYKGVCFDKSRSRWLAGIKVNYRRINLGRFATELDAAMAYDTAARQLHGDFACLNFPDTRSRTLAVPGNQQLAAA